MERVNLFTSRAYRSRFCQTSLLIQEIISVNFQKQSNSSKHAIRILQNKKPSHTSLNKTKQKEKKKKSKQNKTKQKQI